MKKSKSLSNVQSEIVKTHLNIVQRQMFRRLMYGLKEYSPEQISAFSPKTIEKIAKDHKKANHVLHVMKSKKMYKAETDLINALFPGFNIGSRDYDWFIDIPRTVTLRTLGITTSDIIVEFIDRKLLPRTFYQLSNQTINLP